MRRVEGHRAQGMLIDAMGARGGEGGGGVGHRANEAGWREDQEGGGAQGTGVAYRCEWAGGGGRRAGDVVQHNEEGLKGVEGMYGFAMHAFLMQSTKPCSVIGGVELLSV